MTTALFHFLWQGAAIATILAIAHCFVRNASTRYALACAALLALPLAFLTTLALATPSPAPAIRFVTPLLPRPELLPTTSSSGRSIPLDPVFWWTLGVSLVYAYRIFGWLSAQWLRRTAVCAAPLDWQRRIPELAHRIGLTRQVALLESMLAKTPVTIGTLQPVILFPIGLLAGMPTEHVEAILLHELAHIRRHDYLVNLAQSAIEGLLFYHPATWWISHVIRREREHCCDDLAASCSSTLTYTQALAALAEHRVQTPVLAASGGLMSRIHRLLYRNQRITSPSPAAFFLTLATSAAMFAFKPTPKPQATPAASTPVLQPTARPQVPAPQPKLLAQAQTQPNPQPQSQAAPASPYANWVNEEVTWIISPEERAAFLRLQTDDERQQFIKQFWLRRDPTPDTLVNEVQEEHYRRIAWSNDHFFSPSTVGWKTDRGIIYIRFGAPDEREEHPPTESSRGFEKWRHKFIEGVGEDVIIEFINESGQLRMSQDPELFRRFLGPPAANPR